MQVNIIEVKTKIKNVNAYNVGSLLEIKQDTIYILLEIKQDKVVSRKYRQ